jgi:hypothetical protein
VNANSRRPVLVALAAAVALGLVVVALLWVRGFWATFAGDDDPLVLSSMACDVEQVEDLLQEGGKPNREVNGTSAVFAAAGGGRSGDSQTCLATLELLVANGGDVKRTEFEGGILEPVAVAQKDPAVVDYLVSLGADPCLPLSERRQRIHGTKTLAELAELRALPDVAAAIRRVTASCSW